MYASTVSMTNLARHYQKNDWVCKSDSDARAMYALLSHHTPARRYFIEKYC